MRPRLLRTWKTDDEFAAVSDDGALFAAHAGASIQISDPVTGRIIEETKNSPLESRVLGFGPAGETLVTATDNVLAFARSGPVANRASR